MPISRRSGATKSPRAASLTTRSPIAMRPASFCSRPAIIRSVVVLPQPDGPEQRQRGGRRRTVERHAVDGAHGAEALADLLDADRRHRPLLVDLLRELEHLVLELRIRGAEQLRLRERPRLRG